MEEDDAGEERFVSNSLQIFLKVVFLSHEMYQGLNSLRSCVGQVDILKSELKRIQYQCSMSNVTRDHST